MHKVEVTYIPGTKDNQDEVSNPVLVQGSQRGAQSLAPAADSSPLEVDNPTSVPGAGTREMGDRVDTPVEREAPLMEMKAMSRSRARGG